ncbi:two-component regulator propeller domain-containing protein [Emticicia agri]|uniref:Two component regulator propeller n=1 Tax=Emticicia agri TaxID=2492393 RepID=A0A4Q5LX30_9BACT|nr:two-component regulator propeller domain-containing protein [Emticicia agri]RYU94294.1 hypothetical protein EWM59_17915 [Emticicia agri]
MKYPSLLLLTLFFLLTLDTHAQKLVGKLEFMGSHNYISKIMIQDTTIYIATAAGLVIRNINGKKIKEYMFPSTMPRDEQRPVRIRYMDFDKKSNLWICFEDGVIRKFNGKSWEKPFADSVRSSFIAFDNAGNMWMSKYSNKKALLSYIENNIEKLDTTSGIIGAPIKYFKQHKDGRYWCGTDRYTYYKEKDGNKWIYLKDSYGDSGYLYEHPITKDFWFGTKTDLYQWNGKEVKIHKYAGIAGSIYGVTSDKAGDLWLSINGGLIRWNKTKEYKQYWETGKYPLSGLSGVIGTDKNGKIWMGGFHGLHCLDKGKWTSYYEDGIQGYDLHSYLLDSKNRLWLATNTSRLACKTKDKWDYYQLSPFFSPKQETIVWKITEASDGTIWSATGHGINFFNGNIWQQVPEFHSKFNRERPIPIGEKSLVISKNNGVYILADQEIYKKDGQSWQPLGIKELKISAIHNFYVDANNTLWIFSINKGYKLLKVKLNDKNKAESFEETLKNEVYCFFEDNQKNLWVGTGRGAFVLKNNAWVYYNNLSNDNTYGRVHGICQDSEGALWFLVQAGSLHIIKIQDNCPVFHKTDLGWGFVSNPEFRSFGKGVSFKDNRELVIFTPE